MTMPVSPSAEITLDAAQQSAIDLFRAGHHVGVLGGAGSGKSTVLAHLANLLQTAGKTFFHGVPFFNMSPTAHTLVAAHQANTCTFAYEKALIELAAHQSQKDPTLGHIQCCAQLYGGQENSTAQTLLPLVQQFAAQQGQALEADALKRLRENLPAVDYWLIDDAQHLTPPEWQVLGAAVQKGARLFLAGNCDANLFGRHGSLGAQWEERLKALPHAKTMQLPNSYRLAADVQKQAQNIPRTLPQRGSKIDMKKPTNTQGQFHVKAFENPAAERKAVVQWAQKYQGKPVGVVVRTPLAALQWHTVLQLKGIPLANTSTQWFWQRPAPHFFLRALAAVAGQGDMPARLLPTGNHLKQAVAQQKLSHTQAVLALTDAVVDILPKAMEGELLLACQRVLLRGASLTEMLNPQRESQPQNHHAGVQVLAVGESALPIFAHVWVAGVNQDSWPAALPEIGGDSDHDKRLLFAACTCSTGDVMVSYSGEKSPLLP